MSAKGRILSVGDEAGYPVGKDDLLARLEAEAPDPDALLVLQAINDDRFVSHDELEQRLDEALGMPAADTETSILAEDTDWRPQ